MDDTIRVICPGINAKKKYLKIHKVSALSFNECLLETQKTLIATCDGSSRSEEPTIVSVRRFSRLPSSQAILFEPGETYYWIATSTGERDGIDQTQRGMCAAYNMRLVIHVREYSKESSTAIPRTTTSRAVQRDPSSRQYGSESGSSKFTALAHSFLYEHRREPKFDGFTSEQLQKVAALAQQGATGTFSFDTPVEVSETVTDAPLETENVYWDTAPLLQDVLNSASDNIVLGSNGDGDEEGTFVVHEDIGRSYEYQSDAVGSSSVVRLLYATFFLLIWNSAF
uniref:Ephrin RBD domain-containing protein n=1 Tax=Angiostrongylus cantonensis TaxID=6313 RepID=A0A0K0CY24_ANGCA